eukprot:gene30446-35456_t
MLPRLLNECLGDLRVPHPGARGEGCDVERVVSDAGRLLSRHEYFEAAVRSLTATDVEGCVHDVAAAAVHKSKGGTLFKQGKYAEAAEAYSETSKLYCNRALCHLRIQPPRPRHADSDASAALDADPSWHKAVYCSLSCRSDDKFHFPASAECGVPWTRVLPDEAVLATRLAALNTRGPASPVGADYRHDLLASMLTHADSFSDTEQLKYFALLAHLASRCYSTSLQKGTRPVFDGCRLTARCSRGLPKGALLNISYGPQRGEMSRTARQHFLSWQYHFDCLYLALSPARKWSQNAAMAYFVLTAREVVWSRWMLTSELPRVLDQMMCLLPELNLVH